MGLKNISSNSTYPFSIFEMSKISLIIESKSSELLRIICTKSVCSSSKLVEVKNLVNPTIPFRGVRIS